MARAIAWGAAALVVLALVFTMYRPAQSGSPSGFDRFARTFMNAPRQFAPPVLAVATTTPAPALQSHRSPPPVELLAEDVQAQAAYDVEAKPGDFVTPPSVSIAH